MTSEVIAGHTNIQVHTQAARALQAVCLTFPRGQRDEPTGQEGLAHLLEHLFHCRGEHGTSSFFASMGDHGAICNAYTGADYLQFWVSAPADQLRSWAEQVADRLSHPTWSRATLVREHRVIAHEVNGKVEQHPHRGFTFHHTRPALFADHANAHTGFLDNPALRDLSDDDLRAAFHDFLDPAAAVLTSVGPAQPNELRDELRPLLDVLEDRPSRAEPASGRAFRLAAKRELTIARLEGSPTGRAVTFPVAEEPGTDWASTLAIHQVLTAGLAQMGAKSLVKAPTQGAAVTGRVGINTDVNEDRSPSCLTISATTPPEGNSDWLPDLVQAALSHPRLDDRTLWEAARAYVWSGVAKKVDTGLARARVTAWLHLFCGTDVEGYFAALHRVGEANLAAAVVGLRQHGGTVIRL